MNWAHVHLLFNHVPLVATALGILLLAWSAAARSEELRKGAYGLFVVGALLTLPTYFSGGPAEGVVKGLPGVTEAVIDPHEEAATVAAVVIGFLGVMALAALVLAHGRPPVPAAFAAAVAILAVAAVVLMARAANLGGQIRHQEIRALPEPAAGSSGTTP
ncbi:MAG TPA: hypothetical protein VFT43_12525 [Candidatus Polarisedimenticolia bacterium]|nr:hypothetical protein [Candidatus Polarisedimenticolia bacterium]